MAEGSGSRSTPLLAFLVGGVVVVVAVIGWFVWSGRTPAPDPGSLSIDLKVPTPPNLPRPAPMPRPDPPPLPGAPPLH